MLKRRIGRSPLVVSEICMGTMTFGSSCDEKTSVDIMKRAYEAGIDFFDTAELYPVPPKKEWVYRTEEIVGKWLKSVPRDSVFIATKVAGPGHGWFTPPVREGRTALDRHHIRKAVEGSLKRLHTDYIDLYQTHWPDPAGLYEETLETLDDLQREGKIRVAGCSNETAYGLTKSLWASESMSTLRYESIQNNFSILNRRFEDSLAQVCNEEKVSLLPYSPLAGGVATGKYLGGRLPEGARFSKYIQAGARQKKMAERFLNSKSLSSVERLKTIADELNTSLAALALKWSMNHDFVASTIVGANTVEQLNESLGALELELSADILERIDHISADIMYPLG